jgi:hypothetical protein
MGGRMKKKGHEPERTAGVHFIQHVALAIFRVMRSEVLNCRLIRPNEHEMRRKHSHSKYRE